MGKSTTKTQALGRGVDTGWKRSQARRHIAQHHGTSAHLLLI